MSETRGAGPSIGPGAQRAAEQVPVPVAPVVVGSDGSAGGRRALDWALTEAAELGVPLEVVGAWHWDGLEEGPLVAGTPAEARDRAQRQADEAVAAALETRRASGQPVPVVSTQVVEGAPGTALVAASRGARMLVLGSHGHGLLHQAVVGSVSRYCIRHATCPIVVVPVPHAERAATSREVAATRAGSARA